MRRATVNESGTFMMRGAWFRAPIVKESGTFGNAACAWAGEV